MDRPQVVITALVGLFLASATAGAQTSVGAGGVPSWSAYKGWSITSWEIQGWPADTTDDVLSQLALRGRRKILGRKRTDFYPQVLRDDIRRIEIALAREGWPSARIAPLLRPDIRRRELRLLLQVDPGEPVVVDGVEVVGWPKGLSQPALGVRPHGRVRDAEIEHDREKLKNSLEDQGYAHVSIESRLEKRTEHSAVLRWLIDPGSIHVYASISVTGVAGDLENLVRKHLEIHPGDRFSRAALSRAEENLRLMRMFRRIRLETVSVAPESLQLLCDLAARPYRSVRLGGVYYTDDGPGFDTSWSHRNLLRGGRGLQARLAATRFAVDGGVSLSWPAAIGPPRTWTILDVTALREFEDAYTLSQQKLGLRWIAPFSKDLRLSLGVQWSHVDFDARTAEPDLETPRGFLTRVEVSGSFDHVDDPLEPHRGRRVNAEIALSPPGLGSVAEFLRARADFVEYVPWAETVVVSRLASGWGWAFGPLEGLLPSDRFFAGGSRSMRGFRRHQLGPVDDLGQALGGEALAEASLEWRIPVYRGLHLALFTDAGQVWSQRQAFALGDLATAVGGGLYLHTLLGVFRVDVAKPLQDPGEGEPRTLLHVSIGQPW